MQFKKFYISLILALFAFSGLSLSAQSYSISGTILDGNGIPVENATLTLTSTVVSSQEKTNSNGNYSFSNIADGSYKITPTLVGFSFTPADQNIVVAGTDISNIDFTAKQISDPTDIAGCKLWIDGADPAANGTPVAGPLPRWKDKSGNGNDLIQNSGKPVPSVALDRIGGNSIVEFKGGSQSLEFTTDVNVRTVFWVIKEKNQAAAHFFLGEKRVDSFHRGLKNDGTYSPSGTYWWRSTEGLDDAADEVLNGQTYLDGNPVDGKNDIFPVGEYHIVSLVTTGPVVANTLSSATQGIDRSWNGEIAEIIIYDVELNDADRNSVDNYLKNKWFKPTAVDDHYVCGKDMHLNISESSGVLANDSDIEGNALSAILDTPPSDGILTLNSDGSFSYDPAAGFEGSITFTYTANNSSKDSLPATVTITIKNPTTDQPPFAFKDNYSTLKNTPISVNAEKGLLANDRDNDNDPIYAVLLTDVQYGTLTLNADGAFTYEPSSDWTGNDTFTYKTTDNILDSGAVSVTISVKSKVTEPLDLMGCVMWLDGADPKDDGNPVPGKLDAWKNKANSALNPYNPDEAFQPTVVLDALNDLPVVEFSQGKNKLDILDPKDLNKHKKIYGTTYFWVLKEDDIDQSHCFLGNSDNTAFARGLTNDGAYNPDGKYWDDAFAADEVKNGQTFIDGTAVNGKEDVFPVGDYHIVSLVATDQVGFDQITQDRAYIADRSWSGGIAEIIAYDRALSNEERIAVESYLDAKWVSPLIKARDDEYITQKNQTLNIDAQTGLLANDLATGTTAVLESNVSSGTLTLNPDGSFDFIPETDFSGITSFTYKITDGSAESNVATVTLKVLDPATNNTPVTLNDVYPAGKNSILSVNAKIGVLANDSDPDADTITAVLKDNVSKGILTFNADGSFEYTPAPGWTGKESFTYYATDGVANSNIATVLISVVGNISIPTDIPGCVMWIDGADPKNDGQPVAGKIMAWKNKADDTRTPYQPTPNAQASLVLNGLNGLPVMDFTGGKQSYDIVDTYLGKQNLIGSTYFWVLKENNIAQTHFFMGYLDPKDNSKTPFHRGITNDGAYAPNGKYWDDIYSSPDVRNGETFLDGVPVDGQQDVFPIGDFHIVSLVTTAPVTFNQITQDRIYMGDRSWDGEIAEIIVYSGTLADTARKGVESYLKSKWFAETPTYSVSGKILDDSSNPVAGIDVKIDSTHWTTTNADGTYIIQGLINNIYTVTPSSANYILTPISTTATVSGADVTNIDFTATQDNAGAPITIPTDIPSCVMWLDGADPKDDGIPMDGKLDGWKNKADSNRMPYQPDTTKQPSVVLNELHGHSILQFTGGNQYYDIIDNQIHQKDITATTFFWVLKENNINQPHFFLGCFDPNNSANIPFHRGITNDGTFSPDGKYWDDTYAAAEVRNGDTFLDGQPVNGVNDVFPVGDYHIVSLVATGPVNFNQITQGTLMGNRSWDGGIAEIIAYNRTLSDADRKAVEDYLNDKWMAPSHAVTGNITVNGKPLTGITVTAGSESAITDANGNYSIPLLPDGTYTVVPSSTAYSFIPTQKTVNISGKDESNVDFVGSISFQDPSTIAGCVLWVDGADPLNNGEAFEGELSIWKDKSHKSNDLFTYYNNPLTEVVPNALAKKSVVKFTNGDEVLHFRHNVDVRTAFWVLKETDRSEAHALLGGYNFHRGLNNDGSYSPNGAYWWRSSQYPDSDTSDEILDGNTYLDGILVNGEQDKFPLDEYHIVSLVTTGPVEATSLSDYIYPSQNRSWKGEIAELIIFNAPLNDADRKMVENYLNKKWFVPLANNDKYSSSMNTILDISASLGVLANDTDNNGKNLNATLILPPEVGTLHLHSDGSFTFEPPAGFTGTVEFSYKVDNGTHTSDPAIVSIYVQDPAANTSPVAVSDNYLIFRNSVLYTNTKKGVLANDSDADNDPLFAILIDNVQHGTLTFNPNGSFDYTPFYDWSGKDSFTYKVSDNIHESNLATVNISVRPAMADPSLIPGCVMWMDGADPLGDGSTVIGSLPKWENKANKHLCAFQKEKDKLALVIHNSLNGLPTLAFYNNGAYYHITNDQGNAEYISAQTYFWVLKEDRIPTDPPHFFLGNKESQVFARGEEQGDNETGVGNGIYWSKYASDSVQKGKTYIDGMEVDGMKDVFPNHEFHIVTLITKKPVMYDQISLDGSGAYGSRSWKGNIAEIITYDRPLSSVEKKVVEAYLKNKWITPKIKAVDDFYVAEKNHKLTVHTKEGVIANDKGDNVLVSLLDDVDSGNLTLNNDGSFEFVPKPEFTGNITFTYQLSVGKSKYNIATVTIKVVDPVVNHQPVALEDTYFSLKNSTLTLDASNGVLVNDIDADDDPLTAVLESTTIIGSLDFHSDGSFEYTPPPGWTGNDSFSYHNEDPFDEGNSITVKISVVSNILKPTQLVNCVLWLDADTPREYYYNNNNNNKKRKLLDWSNLADPLKSCYQPNNANQPTIIPKTLNNHSVIKFTGGYESFNIVNPKMIQTKIKATTFFWVLKENNRDHAHFFLGDSQTTPFHRGLSRNGAFEPTGTYWDYSFAAQEVLNGKTYLDGIEIDGVNDVFPIGEYHVVSLVATGPLEFDQISQDGYVKAYHGWDGEIAEIIAYKNALSDNTRMCVEKYLMQKWFNKGKKASLSGKVVDENQKGIEGVTVKIDSNHWTTTNNHGLYKILDIPNGNATVTPEFKNYSFDPIETSVNILNGDTHIGNVNFTGSIIPDSYILSGTILDSKGEPIQGVMISVDPNHSASSDENGDYIINDLIPGDYTITPALTGYSFTPITSNVTINDADLDNLDFTATKIPPKLYSLTVNNGTGDGSYSEDDSIQILATIPPDKIFDAWTGDTQYIDDTTHASAIVTMPPQNITINATFKTIPPNTHTISGRVTGDVAAGVKIAADANHFSTTDANGNYSIAGLLDGNYNVTPTLDGYTFTPPVSNVVLAGNGVNVPNINFVAVENTPKQYSLTVNNGTGSGQYFPNNSVTISATVPDGRIFDAWTGDTQYLADAALPSTTVTMPAQNITLNATFKEIPPNTHSISGIVTGAVSAGVTVTADATHSTTTDAAGNYTITDLSDGSYNITPTLAGYSFTPPFAKVAITGSGTDLTDINFVSIENETQIYTLTVNHGTGSGQYSENDTAQIAANIPNGLIFDAWTGDSQYIIDPNLAATSVTMPARDITVNATFKNPPPDTFSISGTVSGDIAMGVTVTIDANHFAITDDDGNFTINGLLNGEYTIVPSLDEYTFSPENINVTINNADEINANFISTKISHDVKITVGSRLNYRASDVPDLKGAVFAKPPKLYGVLENGKKGSFKKVKSSTGSEFSGVWGKKIALYDKKALKSGYKTYFDSKGPSKPADITVMAKGKTDAKDKINAEIQVVHLVPPVITDIQNAAGNSITTAQPGATIVLVGQFFGEKPPKVALEVNGKLLKCKVDKKALKFQNEQGKSSAMDPIAGDSSLTIILPSKKLQPGSYPIVLDNKVGIATTPGKSGSLPIISIAK